MSSIRQPIRLLGGGPPKAWQTNRVIDNMASQRPVPRIGVSHTTRGSVIRSNRFKKAAGDRAELWAFGVTVSGNVFTIQPGHVTIVNRTIHAVNGGTESTATTYTHGGTDQYLWIYVDIPYDLMAPSISGVGAYPTPTVSGMKYPLARFRSDDSGVTYTADGNAYILHRGDILLLEPQVWGSV